ncbi:putative bifunctional diguanylate cyclase/phosphodiesterase [Methylobacterium sp. JK268]
MIWKWLEAPASSAAIDLAVRLYQATSETDFFTILSEIQRRRARTITVDGFSVALDGRRIRHVLESGALRGAPVRSAIEAWLVDESQDDAILDRPEGGVHVLRQRLTWEGHLLGGLVLTGERLTRTDMARCAVLARLASGALAGLHQRRLSQLVIEAMEESEEALAFYDENEDIVFTNEAYHRIFPHYPDRAALRGRSHLDLYRMDLAAGIIDDPLARGDPDAFLAERARLSRALVGRQREIQRIDGRTYIYTRTRSRTGATLSRRTDITEQAQTEARLRERETELHALAFRDPLTGLYNRAFLREREAVLRRRRAADRTAGVAVLVIGIDGLRAVNDTFGHDCGDEVLAETARRLARALPESDALLRLSSDEFVVLVERKIHPAELAGLAERIIAAAAPPMTIGDRVIRVGASVGIAMNTGPDLDLGVLMSDADLAMGEAKSRAGGSYRFSHPDQRRAMVERLALVEDLRAALRTGGFTLHYQPQFATRDGRLVGFEALARWNHPRKGTIPPDVFIPVLEEHGLVEALGSYVLRTACAEARDWPEDLRIAVNVSPLQVRGGGFAPILEETLLRTGLAPQRLELEITESVLLVGEDRTRAELDRWKALGVRVALDDFGSGYSSLSYLGAFPIDKIKIDRTFIGRFDPAAPDAAPGAILNAIINLGRALGLTVTAEGIERDEQLAYLRERECTEVQGFLLGRPLTPAEARALIRKTRPSDDALCPEEAGPDPAGPAPAAKDRVTRAGALPAP